jgi:hypothetical protein
MATERVGAVATRSGGCCRQTITHQPQDKQLPSGPELALAKVLLDSYGMALNITGP